MLGALCGMTRAVFALAKGQFRQALGARPRNHF